ISWCAGYGREFVPGCCSCSAILLSENCIRFSDRSQRQPPLLGRASCIDQPSVCASRRASRRVPVREGYHRGSAIAIVDDAPQLVLNRRTTTRKVLSPCPPPASIIRVWSTKPSSSPPRRFSP